MKPQATEVNGGDRTAVLVGEESLLVQCAAILEERGVRVVTVATVDPDIEAWAAGAGVPVVANDRGLADALRPRSFDYLFSITNLRILPDEVVAMAGRLAINFHDGPLPAYAGLHATTWALLAGEAEHGVSWHTIEAGVDEGDVVGQVRFDIAPDETAYTLNVRCYEHAISSFATLVDELLTGTVTRRQQDLSARSYFGLHRRPRAAGTIDWSEPAARIGAVVRALDLGQHTNPLARAKLLLGNTWYVVPSVTIGNGDGATTNGVDGPGDRRPPGTVVAVEAGAVTVAAGEGTVTLETLVESDRREVSAAEAIGAAGLGVGDRLPALDRERAERLTAVHEALCRHERGWVGELEALQRVELPYPRSVAGVGETRPEVVAFDLPAAVEARLDATVGDDQRQRAELIGAAFACYLARLTGSGAFHLSHRGAGTRVDADLRPWFAPRVPLPCRIDATAPVADVLGDLQATIARCREQGTYLADVAARYPTLTDRAVGGARLPLSIGLDIGADPVAEPSLVDGLDLTLVADDRHRRYAWRRDTGAFAADVYDQVQRQFLSFLEQAMAEPDVPVAEISLLTPAERHRVLVEWNDTATPIEAATLPALLTTCAAERPGDPALVHGTTALTYAELDDRSNRLARQLRELGAGRGRFVGIFMDRGADMVVGLLGILKAGAAYLPLDPSYPRHRIAFMIEDADPAVVLTQSHLAAAVPDHDGPVLEIDGHADRIASQPGEPIDAGITPADLAYLIYTSGSTGTPKGVMVTHANVVNFLAGMDDHLDHAPGDTWLTVTSLSFDISVLEIFWTLTRGLRLVVYADELADDRRSELPSAPAPPTRDIGFSLFYFASDESEAGDGDKYELLLEGARFADRHDFEAVWTPERHFYAFGGLYPNPSVTSAAIAAITERVAIRAGSCVLPLHHPVRVAEEWAVVDNLSRGRVGIAFAAGWQPVDFVLRPENFADRKAAVARDAELVKRLWRGETVTMDGPTGPAEVRTLPRPVQPELPTWLTVAGNPDTFRAAGAGGHNVLTHLLGQTVEDVADKIRIYRQARRDAGIDGEGHVTLMLHTLVGDDADEVRDLVRGPMIEYLRSSVALIKEAAWSFPTFQQKAAETGRSPLELFDEEDLTEEEMEALLEHAFDRYFEGSALFGTPDTCRAMVDDLRRIGVDEIACQVDFGLAPQDVLSRLPLLDEVRRRTRETVAAPAGAAVAGSGPTTAGPEPTTVAEDRSIPALIERHEVTHFQCTPSMGSMLIADDRFRTAATRLKRCLMGGEAFPQALAKEITDIVDGTVLNVYGPTETTIWSSVQRVEHGDRPVSIGRPLANQQLYVVDRNLQPCPVGVPGELLIGGDGVTAGYLNRPELTAERFVPDHLRPDPDDTGDGPSPRLYRTGDLVRHDTDGSIEFLGRMDFQVKVRGHRIELGEIEARLDEHDTVRESVVVAREDTPGDQRLVAYVIARPGAEVDGDALRDHLGQHLPEFMVPAHYVSLREFPLTPNLKTDRKALPPPDQPSVTSVADYVAPQAGVQEELVELWQQVLGLARVGVDDNFFDLGGHSLLAVQLHRRITASLGLELSITDVFRFPTIAALTAHLDDRDRATEQAAARATDRASARRQAMANRRARRRG